MMNYQLTIGKSSLIIMDADKILNLKIVDQGSVIPKFTIKEYLSTL